MRKKFFFAFVLLFCLSSAARAATTSLALTPEELVHLLNGVADTSASWPVGADGKKVRIPDPTYTAREGRREFHIRLNPIATIAGPVDPTSGHMQRYEVSLLLSDAESIARLSSLDSASPVKESARLYSAVCASLLLLNADTVDRFTLMYDKCKAFFTLAEGEKGASLTETLRVNQHVSMRFSYTDKSPSPYILRRIEIFPTK